MPPADTLLSFFAVAVVLGLTPGPDNLFVLLQSAAFGRRTGLLVTLGLCAGLLVHTAAVALGLAALLAASPTAFTALKLAGAAYLLVLAWGAWRAPAASLPEPGADAVGQPAGAGPGVVRLVGRGLLMNLGNPKVAVFFLAFLPQFVVPGAGPVAQQVAVLGTVFVAATLLVFGGVAWSAAWVGGWLRRSRRARHWLNRGAALVFAGLAARLALSAR